MRKSEQDQLFSSKNNNDNKGKPLYKSPNVPKPEKGRGGSITRQELPDKDGSK